MALRTKGDDRRGRMGGWIAIGNGSEDDVIEVKSEG